MKFLREGSMSDVYYTFQDIANNPDYSDIDAIAQIKKVMSHPTDDAEQFVARKLKLMHDTIAKHPSYKNDPMGVYEEMLDMIRTEYHDETYESKDMNPTTQTFSEDNDTNSLEQWKADVRKQYPQQASQIKFKGKGFGDTIVAEIPGKDQAFGEFNMETGDAWVAPMDEGVAEGLNPKNVVVRISGKEYAAMTPEQKAAKQQEWQQLKQQAKKRLQNFTIVDADKEPNPNVDDQGRMRVPEGEEQLTVQQLATISDEALDNAYHYGRSSPGNTFGWQANLKSASYAKQMIDKGITDIEQISDAIHKGWNVTAQAFVKNPDQFDDTAKLQAAGKLEGKLQQRAQLMKQNYAQLPDEEKEKDRVVARALLQALKGQQGVAEATGDEPFDKMMTQIVKGAKPNTPKRFIKNIKKVAKIKYKFQVGDWVTIDPNEIAKWPTSGMIGRISRFSSDGDAVVNVNPGGGASGGGSSGTHTTVPTSMLEKLAVNLDEPGVTEGSHSESDEELENFLDSTKPELDRLYKLAKTSKKAKAAYYELKEKWDAANSKLYGLDEQGVAEALDKEGDYHVSVQKGKFLPSDRGGGSDENLNYLHDLMNISGTGGGPMLVTISDPRIATEVAAMYGGKVLKTRYGTYRIVQSKGQNQKTPTPEPELVGMREDGVAEGNYPNYPKEPDLDQDKRDFKRQELQHELGHERNNYAVVIDGRTWKVFADQRKAQNIARSLKSRGKNASVQETGASPTSESVGSGTGSTGRVSEDSAQGTENKQAWDKGHEAGYTGNEKCPCKPGSAEEKAWNAGHKVGRDERSHERHGVKEGSDFKNKAIKQQLNIVNTIQSLDLPAPMKEYLVAINDPNGKPFKMAYYSFPKGESARRDAAQIIGKKYGVDPAELVNAEHKFDHLYEPGGMKEGNMKSSANNPTGPSFAGGKWKGTDSAAQAKNKYVGEISEGTMPSVKLMRNIAEGLVRVDDLVLNRPVYGKPTDQDRRAVYRMVREFADAGIDYNDAVVELVEYFKHELSELAVAPTIPAVGGKPAIVAPTGTSVGSTTPPTANTAATTPGTVSSTAPGAAPVVAPPVTQQGVDALAQMVKNAGLSPSQISTLMSKAK